MSYLIKLYCPMCSNKFFLDGGKVGPYHSAEFGWICSHDCYIEAQHKSARVVLQKKEE